MRRSASLCVLPVLLLSVTDFVQMLPVYAQDKAANRSNQGYGTVEGQVVTKEGLPVADATVYAFQLGGSPQASTNAAGKFVLTNLSAGKHLIIAYKETDGFPNLVWSFYSEVYENDGKVVVNIEENQSVPFTIIRLGPKSSRLLIRVIDARTKRPIRDASLTLNHKGKPDTRFEPGATNMDGEFEILIPPSRAINVVVKAPGYKTWRYFNRRSADRDAIRLLPGSSIELVAELSRA